MVNGLFWIQICIRLYRAYILYWYFLIYKHIYSLLTFFAFLFFDSSKSFEISYLFYCCESCVPIRNSYMLNIFSISNCCCLWGLRGNLMERLCNKCVCRSSIIKFICYTRVGFRLFENVARGSLVWSCHHFDIAFCICGVLKSSANDFCAHTHHTLLTFHPLGRSNSFCFLGSIHHVNSGKDIGAVYHFPVHVQVFCTTDASVGVPHSVGTSSPRSDSALFTKRSIIGNFVKNFPSFAEFASLFAVSKDWIAAASVWFPV